MLIAQYKKGLAAFEGQKKGQKRLLLWWGLNPQHRGKKILVWRPSQHGHGRFIRKDQMIDIKNLLQF